MCQQPKEQKTTQEDNPRQETGRRATRKRKRTTRRSSPTTLGIHQARVLLAEDDHDMRVLLASALRRAGYAVEAVDDGSELLDQLSDALLARRQVLPDMIISDIRMPGWSGIDVLASLRQSDWSMPVILITAFGDAKIHARAEQLGAATLLDKPFDVDELLRVAGSILPARF
jgi:DNA-binding response OmpR family regulator